MKVLFWSFIIRKILDVYLVLTIRKVTIDIFKKCTSIIYVCVDTIFTTLNIHNFILYPLYFYLINTA